MENNLRTGSLLVAEPFMQDVNFKRAVVLITDHGDEEGTVGFIINKPMTVRVNELVEDFPEIEGFAHYGGPVSTNTIHYIHNVGMLLDGSTEIGPGVFWGGEFEKLKFLIAHELVKGENIRFFVGYAGWSPGQLAEEMETGSWITSEVHANYLFKSKPTRLWNQVMHNKGDVFSVLSQLPEDLSLN
ncbi:MAG: YqgE/AlgH family protein [Bacteroidota bacterium]|nr:YqgE/AlgH family protein [Bacteroidota bacterium]